MRNIQTSKEIDNRKVQRVPTELKTLVKVKESDDVVWKEVTKVTTVSRNGAGFYLTRECMVGRLVTLVMPLPDELRAYAYNEDLYPVMGLVQYCNASTVDKKTVYHVGVAFVGKQIPASYKADPQQSYRICAMTKDGLWEITEAGTPFQSRKDPRFCVPIEVTVSLLKNKKKAVSKETNITHNISASGVSVNCSLDANVGDTVKFASKEHNFYALAVVRNRHEREDKPPTLHLEFVDAKFPVDKILFAHENTVSDEVAEPEYALA